MGKHRRITCAGCALRPHYGSRKECDYAHIDRHGYFNHCELKGNISQRRFGFVNFQSVVTINE